MPCNEDIKGRRAGVLPFQLCVLHPLTPCLSVFSTWLQKKKYVEDDMEEEEDPLAYSEEEEEVGGKGVFVVVV